MEENEKQERGREKNGKMKRSCLLMNNDAASWLLLMMKYETQHGQLTKTYPLLKLVSENKQTLFLQLDRQYCTQIC